MSPDILLILKVVGAVAVATLAVIAAVWRAIALPNLRGDFVTTQNFDKFKEQDAEDCNNCRMSLDQVDEKLANDIAAMRVELVLLSKESAEHKGNIKWIRDTLTEVKQDMRIGLQALSDKLDALGTKHNK